ncbi:MAG: hypothetical protein JRI22_00510 [Deltaproteobacteria bacterium]|nr:hypothetical protein [Deltaproteobacteria bacterium]
MRVNSLHRIIVGITMSEVKSTIDLIMEKTRGMKLTAEEKDQNRKEKIKREVRLLVLPYLRGEASLGRLRESLSDETLMSAVEVLGEALQIEEDNSRALEGLRALCGKEKGMASMLEDIRTVLEEYEAHRSQVRTRLESEMLQELARWGISGPAVQPAVDANPLWLDQRKELEKNYTPRLRDAADRLVTSCEKMRSESSQNSDV